ncbi:glycoside hydrolase family 5 protein [Saccharata proteae CBS 121410]|uniref:glucan 1,3-beta-glucosidase n=1 Tax=Saccharata proteae CBS 121410 TaxID=1314787 RepID=A0A9P4HSH9_9PEZI|nr:glycoside hydrolase family 5 protein [Saccharata proteae CBS 121410]
MRCSTILSAGLLAACSVTAAPTLGDSSLSTTSKFIDWTTYKANGANIGAWLEQEKVHDPDWWNEHAPDAEDEWTFCETLGSKCGPVLEERYATWINTSTIDKLAAVGVNTLRIPTTYAAWVSVPGSQLYHGNQQTHLMKISKYAIEQYNMHVIIGLHSLPGGVNTLDIGEAVGHDGWFFNATNLDYSFQAIDAILSFIQLSGHTNGFTIAPINEASDNFAGFATAAGLTAAGTAWINKYIAGVLSRISKVDARIPVMLQDCFEGASYWSPFYAAGTNLVFDSHVYYFAASGVYSQYVAGAICGQAAAVTGSANFPVFVGEWSVQTMFNNTFAGRKSIFDTQRYAWQKYAAGGAFWTARSLSSTAVDGQGEQKDYWSYVDLIDAGVITAQTDGSYC